MGVSIISLIINLIREFILISPIKYSVKGPDIRALVDPVIAKTIKIMTIWKLEVIPHLSFSFFIILRSH